VLFVIVRGYYKVIASVVNSLNRTKMMESDIQKQILDYLALKRIFHYRNNSGGFVDSQKHFYRFGALGSPDIVINGQYVGIEVKAVKGKQSDHQKEFQRNLERAGGKYVLAFSLENVIESFREKQCKAG
jgi:hypothetical protein